MPLFIHNGLPLHYLERGRGEPLLLIHGWGSTAADWALQVPAFENRYRVIVPDLPGCGHSASPRGRCTVAGFAEALWALIDHLGESNINIVGFSLGGAVGLEMAVQRPERALRLALINSLASYRLDHWSKWVEALVPLLMIPILGMKICARLAAARLFPSPSQRTLRQRTVASLAAVPARNYLCTGTALLGWSVVDRLHRLTAKTLVIAAENDFTPLEEKRALARRLAADFVLVRGSRHGTPFDAVQVTNRSLMALLEGLPLPPLEERICDVKDALDAWQFEGSLAEEHSIGPSSLRPKRSGLAPAAKLAVSAG